MPESRPVRQRPVTNGRPQAARPARKANAPAKTEDARTRIMKVAADLFSSRGYVGTTMAQIADASGIRSPSLYYHFVDKADILKAIADLTLGSALSESATLLRKAEQSPAQRLFALVYDMVFRLHESDYQLYCMFDPVFHSKEFRSVNGKLIAWLKDMESLIQEGIDKGEIERQNTKSAAAAVQGLIETGIRQHGVYSKLSAEAVARYVASFALKGLVSKDSDIAALLR